MNATAEVTALLKKRPVRPDRQWLVTGRVGQQSYRRVERAHTAGQAVDKFETWWHEWNEYRWSEITVTEYHPKHFMEDAA